MFGKYFFNCIYFYLLGLVVTLSLALHEEDMKYLLKNSYWAKVIKDNADAAVMDGNEKIKISDIIFKDEDNIIINEANLNMKIGQLFTLISAVYSDRLKNLILFLKDILNQLSSDAVDQLENEKLVLKQVKEFRLVLLRMRGSLRLLTDWYCINEKKGHPVMENNHVIRAIDVLLFLNRYSSDNKTLIEKLNVSDELLATFDNDYLRNIVILPFEPFATECNDKMKKCFENDPEVVKEKLIDILKSLADQYAKEIECLGFGYYYSVNKTDVETTVS